MLLLHQCREMVAVSGIAPDSPRLQRGADLSQLHSLVVPPHGIAPRSPAYRAGALLLSYGGNLKKGSPDEVTLPGPPDVSRLLYS
jgi:hypothetical protein